MKTMHDFLALFDDIPPNFPLSLIHECADRHDRAGCSGVDIDTMRFNSAKIRYTQFWWEEQCNDFGNVTAKSYVTFCFIPFGYRVILLRPEYAYYFHDLTIYYNRVISFCETAIVETKEWKGVSYLTINPFGFAVIDSTTVQFRLKGGNTSLWVLFGSGYHSVLYQFQNKD